MTPTRLFRSTARARPGQRGAALLTAMMIVTLVATLASAMVWQQWRAVQVEAAERARTQSAWILSGALDWARLILREDARSSAKTGDGTRLGEPWSFPLAESRLSSFLAADKDNTDPDDGPPAFLSGSIADAQAKYNLRNLIDGETVSPTELAVLRKLLDFAGIAPEIATQIATGLRDATVAANKAAGIVVAPPANAASGGGGDVTVSAVSTSTSSPATALLMPQRLSQLAWFGIDAGSLARMAPYVSLLPLAGTKVNLNTAPREVLAAVIDGLDLAGAERLRLRAPFKGVADAKAVLGDKLLLDADAKRVDVMSYYFEVRGRLRLDDHVLEESSLVQRRGIDVFTLQRERVASREASS